MQDAIDHPDPDPRSGATGEQDDRSCATIAIEIRTRYAAVFDALADL
jgi:hypothetical protein